MLQDEDEEEESDADIDMAAEEEEDEDGEEEDEDDGEEYETVGANLLAHVTVWCVWCILKKATTNLLGFHCDDNIKELLFDVATTLYIYAYITIFHSWRFVKLLIKLICFSTIVMIIRKAFVRCKSDSVNLPT